MLAAHGKNMLDQVHQLLDSTITFEQFKQPEYYGDFYNSILQSFAECVQKEEEFTVEEYVVIPTSLECTILATHNLSLHKSIDLGNISTKVFRKDFSAQDSYVLCKIPNQIICYQFRDLM